MSHDSLTSRTIRGADEVEHVSEYQPSLTEIYTSYPRSSASVTLPRFSFEQLAIEEPLETHLIPAKLTPSRTANVTVETDHRPQLYNKRASGYVSSESPFSLHLWSWKLQLASSLISWAAIITMTVLLMQYREQPLAAWPSTRLSINATIALLGTIVRVTCMFPVATSIVQCSWLLFYAKRDDSYHELGHELGDLELFDNASRGAYGSVKLLFTSKLRLVSIGAILSILALGFETFSQQVLNIHSQDTSSRNVTSVPAVNNYDVSYDFGTWNAAIYAGIYGKSIPDIQLVCPTGECSWPTTPSVGICGECKDITSKLITSCSGDSCTYTTPVFNPVQYGLQCSVPGEYGPMEMVSQAGGVSLTTKRPNTPFGSYRNLLDADIFNVSTLGLGSAIGYENTEDQIVNPLWPETVVGSFDIINVNVSNNATNWLSNDSFSIFFSKPQAMQCNLAFCLQAYETRTTSGTQHQSFVSSSASVLVNPPWFLTSQFVNFTKSFNTGNTNFSMNSGVANGIMCGDNVDGLAFIMSDTGQWNYASGTGSPFISSAALGVIHPDFPNNLDPWIHQFAKSLSNTVRANGTLPDGERYIGTSYGTVAWISVRWYWLTLPVLMVFLSAMFLVMNIVSTARARAPVWKENPLAMLFCEVDPEVKRLVKKAAETSENITKQVGKQRVVLRDEAEGRWIFTSTS